MKALIVPLIVIVSLAYPAIVYFGIQHASPAIFALVLLGISVAKFIFSPKEKDIPQVVLMLSLVAFSLIVALSNSEKLLRMYPVIMSLGMAFLFLNSLSKSQSLIEKFARAAGKEISTNAKRYTRKLTMVWGGLLILNATIAFYFATFASLKNWALYNGLICYVVFAVVFIVELIYRQYYIKKYGQ